MTSTMNHLELGKYGEDLARTALIKKGYEILECNYVWKKTEIDIICRDQDQLVFVEVKTRNTGFFGEPYMAVSRQKQSRIVRVANRYIEVNNVGMESRFDIISIIHNTKQTRMEHIEAAFIPLM